MQQSDSAIGKIIDGYKILDILGQGGMGIVYKAEDVALARQVALKMINPELASQDMFLRRFQLEAKALARVDSPYIVGVHALRKAGEHVFIVMEFVDGWTLSDEMDNGTLDSPRAFSLLKQLLQAFSHAHGVGVIHRDIKPSNIMISRNGRVKVTDFGLAKLRREDGMTTMTQGIAGTARYMSPEQVLGKKIDHRSDIYSLGMTLYHMFAGELPFSPGEGTYSILKRVVEEEFVEVKEINAKIPKPLSQVIAKAIAKDPDNRYQTADEMLVALEKAFGMEAQNEQEHAPAPQRAQARPHVKKDRPAAKSKKNVFLYGAIALCLLLIYPVYSLVTGSGESGEEGTPADMSSVSGQPDVQPGGTQESNGQQSSAEVEVQYAFPVITSSPSGASVFANGRRLGLTPIRSQRLEAGPVEIIVSLQGYIDQRQEIILEPNGTPSIPFELQRERIIAEQPVTPRPNEADDVPVQTEEPVVEANPAGSNTPDETEEALATVQLAAEPAGLIYIGGMSFENEIRKDWPAGDYTIRIIDPNNANVSCEESITIAPGSVTNRTCYFTHKLTIVTANEAGGLGPFANLKINGEDFDTAPLAGHEIKSGTYEVEISKFGYDIDRPTRTIVLRPSFDPSAMTHKETFVIKSQ